VAAPLASAAAAIATLTGVEIDPHADQLRELALAAVTAELEGDIVVYPILEGVEPVACLAIATAVAAGGTGAPVPASGSATNESAPALPSPAGRALVLADVEMGVTAELGRSQMTVRELLSITPGAVIDLDRSVGTPVDLLVNGTAIARGEVVIVDEEFGIRITEILSSRSSAL
jgi:flagellar motor switch protein FliN/FliY